MLFAGPGSESYSAQHGVTLRAALQYFISGKCSISTAAGPVPCRQPLEHSTGAPCQDAPFLSSGVLHSHPVGQPCWWQEVSEGTPHSLLASMPRRMELPGQWAAKGGIVGWLQECREGVSTENFQMELFKAGLDESWSNLVWWKVSLPMAGVGILRYLPTLTIPWFCGEPTL